MSKSITNLSTIHYGPFTANYSIVKDTTPLSRFYTVNISVYYKGTLVVKDDVTVTVCLHLTKGYYSEDLDDYLLALHNMVKRYVWTHLIEEDFTFKGLLCGQAHVLIKRVGNNLLESLYPNVPPRL